VVLKAWRTLHSIRREQAAMAELPVANLSALMANMNRDPKKAKPFSLYDFCVFNDKPDDGPGQLSPKVAAVALALRHEDRAPRGVLAIWDSILAAASESASVPSIRALASSDDRVWILCPRWEGPHVRGGLVCVLGQAHGLIEVRDIDRPLASYQVSVPNRRLAGWIEADLLLKGET
jgi:hypothetical protein